MTPLELRKTILQLINNHEQKQTKLMFNRSFETGGRTVFKVGAGFEILPGESGADLRQ